MRIAPNTAEAMNPLYRAPIIFWLGPSLTKKVDMIDPKLKCNEGLTIIEDIMERDGKMDQGKFLELCNIFRDIHQS